jgi:DNA-binding NarL/FixJ family response regulator
VSLRFRPTSRETIESKLLTPCSRRAVQARRGAGLSDTNAGARKDGASMKLRILLVDDHKILLAGIRAMLDQSQDFEVIGEAETGAEAIAACKQCNPDVIVMDIGLPGMNGIETTQVIVRSAPGTRVVMLSIYCDEHSVVSAIRAGAQAYVLKQAAGRDLLEAMRAVSRGESYLSPQISANLARRMSRAGPRSSLALEILAPRELQVFRLVAAGNASKDIAVTLDLSLETVRSYRKTMMKKLGVSNIAAVTRFAIANGEAPKASQGDRRTPVR